LNILNKLLLVFILFFAGCNDDTTIAFYSWKTKCKIKNDFKYPMYIKVLDISKSSTIKTSCKYKKPYTPVVYIDNNAFKSNKNISKIVLNTIPKNTKEVQFDCDWTPSTQKKYFKFLKTMKSNYKYISATIRLHQIKYKKTTGIPPVHSGVLMFYNMSDFKSFDTRNYVLDIKEGQKYLTKFSYPMKLDLALPLYSMASVFRYNKLVKVIDDIKAKDINKNFLKLKANKYEVLKTHYFKTNLLYKGDIIRIDEVTVAMLKKSIDIMPFDFDKIIYFRYSNLKDWDIKELEKL